ncbi:hypothetical protein GCM10010431_73160 [Streptomyces kunmingensis]
MPGCQVPPAGDLVGAAAHNRGKVRPVPMERGALIEAVAHDELDLLAAPRTNRRTRYAPFTPQVRVVAPALNRVLPDRIPIVNTRAPCAPFSDAASGGIGRALSKATSPTVSCFAA